MKEIQKFPCNTKFTSREILELSELREDNKATKEDYRQMGLVLRDLGCKKVFERMVVVLGIDPLVGR